MTLYDIYLNPLDQSFDEPKLVKSGVPRKGIGQMLKDLAKEYDTDPENFEIFKQSKLKEMARPVERPRHHHTPFEFTINVEDAFDYLDEFKNSPSYPKSSKELGATSWVYTPNKYQILGDRLEARFGVGMVEARKIVSMWFERNNNLRNENKMNKDFTRMQQLAGTPKPEKKQQLDENVGGVVSIGAINQIFDREKSDYEMAFEHFMGERYGDEEEVKEDITDITRDEDEDKVKADLSTFSLNEDPNPVIDQYFTKIVELFSSSTDDIYDMDAFLKALNHATTYIIGVRDNFAKKTGWEEGDIE